MKVRNKRSGREFDVLRVERAGRAPRYTSIIYVLDVDGLKARWDHDLLMSNFTVVDDSMEGVEVIE